MKLKIKLYLNGLKKAGTREIEVNDNLTLKKFCEYVILSMNGNCKHLYQLVINEEYSYLCDGCDVLNFGYEEMMEDLKLEDINLKLNDELMVNYDFRSDWEFILKITEIQDGYYGKEFKVVSGSGVGILEDSYGVYNLKQLTSSKKNEKDVKYFEIIVKGYKDYIEKEFNIDSINEEIENNLKLYYEKTKPKHYIMNISLDGYDKEIKRKISVNSNLGLDSFCRGVITSMRGDLMHGYSIKIGKEYIDEDVIDENDLNYLELKEKQRLKVVYDFGDNWCFNIRVSKVNEGYGEERRFRVISGKGYGIIDDCGGVYNLESIFNGTNEYFEKRDIDDFNIDEINNLIDFVI